MDGTHSCSAGFTATADVIAVMKRLTSCGSERARVIMLLYLSLLIAMEKVIFCGLCSCIAVLFISHASIFSATRPLSIMYCLSALSFASVPVTRNAVV